MRPWRLAVASLPASLLLGCGSAATSTPPGPTSPAAHETSASTTASTPTAAAGLTLPMVDGAMLTPPDVSGATPVQYPGQNGDTYLSCSAVSAPRPAPPKAQREVSQPLPPTPSVDVIETAYLFASPAAAATAIQQMVAALRTCPSQSVAHPHGRTYSFTLTVGATSLAGWTGVHAVQTLQVTPATAQINQATDYVDLVARGQLVVIIDVDISGVGDTAANRSTSAALATTLTARLAALG